MRFLFFKNDVIFFLSFGKLVGSYASRAWAREPRESEAKEHAGPCDKQLQLPPDAVHHSDAGEKPKKWKPTKR